MAGEPSPLEYLTEVADTVQSHAYYTDRVDWTEWEASLPDVVADADDPSDTYPAVRQLVAQLDPHSRFERPAPVPGSSSVPDRLPDSEQPAGAVNAGIGQITLPVARWDPEDPLGTQYVTMAWDLLSAPACGWIVDLRGDGGSAWTLTMALAPLLGPGPAFGFTYRDGETETVSVRDDGSLSGGGRPPVASPDGVAMPAEPSDALVAIIQGYRTASAHEFAVMAFAGRPSSRTFGASTSGLPTAVDDFEMTDGSVLLLTTALGVDRSGTIHDAAIPPDEEIERTPPNPSAPDDPDLARDAAQAWLTTHADCS